MSPADCESAYSDDDRFAFWEGALEASEQARFADHLTRCAPCQGALEELDELTRSLDAELEQSLPLEEFRANPTPPGFSAVRARELRRPGSWLGRAAGALIAASIVVGAVLAVRQPGPSVDHPAFTIAVADPTELRQSVRGAIEANAEFFATRMRGAPQDGPRYLAAPSADYPTVDAALQSARPGDTLILSTEEELPSNIEVTRDENGALTLVRSSTELGVSAVFLDRGETSNQRLLSSYRQLAGATSIDQRTPKDTQEDGFFITIEEQTESWVRVLSVDPCGGITQLFPLDSRLIWGKKELDQRTLPPLEPVVQFLNEDRYRSLSALGPSQWILIDPSSAFHRTDEGIFELVEIDLLRYPRPFRAPPGSQLVIATTPAPEETPPPSLSALPTPVSEPDPAHQDAVTRQLARALQASGTSAQVQIVALTPNQSEEH